MAAGKMCPLISRIELGLLLNPVEELEVHRNSTTSALDHIL
jgi:hypothetical protein